MKKREVLVAGGGAPGVGSDKTGIDGGCPSFAQPYLSGTAIHLLGVLGYHRSIWLDQKEASAP